MGLHRAGTLSHRAVGGDKCLVLRQPRVSAAEPVGPAPGRGRATHQCERKKGAHRQRVSTGRFAGRARDIPPRRPHAPSHRLVGHPGRRTERQRARRPDRRARACREDRRSDRALARVGRRARCRARSRPCGDPRLQGARVELSARFAPTGGAADSGRGDRCRAGCPASDAHRDGARLPRPPAARCGAESGNVREARRRVPRVGRERGQRDMKLHRLRLVNFRQHADTEIVFGDGITGIIGPNGSGKTSLLEAIAWAIYGNLAARGDKDSISNLRAKARAAVRVELEFGLGSHAYRVERGLNNAELYQDGVVVANSLKEVTGRLQRVLGMTHDEFFNTYFTGQKELAVLADATRPERAAFLSRVLRHEQLTIAQERVRERRNALGHEVDGLETGLPPQAELEKERKTAESRLAGARKAATAAAAERTTTQQGLAEEEPRWQQWVERRERTLSLHGDLRVAEQGVVVARQEFQRLDKELAEALSAREELRKLDSDVAPISKLKAELAELERLHREDAARREEQAKVTELARNLNVLDRRIEELADAEAALARATTDAAALAEKLEAAEKLVEEQQAAWVRDKEAAGTRRAALLKQFEDVKKHRDDIERLGPEGQCPTCRRPLGAEHAAVLTELEEQLELIVNDGKWLKQRIEQLAEPPGTMTQAEAARDALREEARQIIEREGNLRAQAAERARAQKERAGLAKRTQEVERRMAARDAGYNAERHNDVRTELARLEPVALQAAALAARAERAEALVGEAELAEKALSAREEHVKQLADAVQAQGFSEPKFQAARERHDRAAHALRAAELAVAETRGELVAAETAVREIERRVSPRRPARQ